MSKRDDKFDELFAQHLSDRPRIVASEDGGALKRIINGRNIFATGQYPSFKGKRGFPEQADHEVGIMQHSDVDVAVLYYTAQPHRVVIPVRWERQPLIYFPDLQRNLADGRIEILETKAENDPRLKDEHYKFKLDVVQLLYEREGWSFRILTEKEILGTRLHDNCEAMCRFAFAKIHPGTIARLENEIDKAGGSVPFCRAAEVVPGGWPILYALMIRRHIQFDVRFTILPQTPVRRVDHAALANRSDPLL
jgi:hypothetical protein